MIQDDTKAVDLAEKIEWVGLGALSARERILVRNDLLGVSRHLQRRLALALWRYYGLTPPDEFEARSYTESLGSLARRDQGRQVIRMIINGY